MDTKTRERLLSTIKRVNKKKNLRTKKNYGGEGSHKLLNIPCAFDIETSSWYEGEEKKACMYIWQFGIDGDIFYGRTWEEFEKFVKFLRKNMSLSLGKRLVVYVQNLQYEYQWIKERFQFTEVFEVDNRKVVKAVTSDGIEFRCSYILSGKKLSDIGKELTKYKATKKDGDLDYEKLRTPLTPLTEKEMGYCFSDVEVVMCYIKEKIETDGSIANIPMTLTGYVRREIKRNCYSAENRNNFSEFMRCLRLTQEVYDMLKEAFQGGYVHCNMFMATKEQKNVVSFDFASSYIAVMVGSDRFPISSAIERMPKNKEEFEWFVRNKACLMNITFKKITLNDNVPAPAISTSKATGKFGYVDNGRVCDGEYVTVTITEQDYEIYKKIYKIEGIKINKFYYFERGYLPKAIVEVLLSLYDKKTRYKGVEDKKTEYAIAKSMLNSIYGMMCTDIMKQYDSLQDYNTHKYRFTYYPWGVWTSAISRRNLFSGIYNIGEDFIYSDTDSIKFKNAEKHMEYIEWYNKNVVKKLDQAMRHYGISEEMTRPLGKQIGVWSPDGEYDRFKGMRAKAYIYEENGEVHLTMSGVSSKTGVEYLKTLGDPIENYTMQTTFPAEYSGKKTHTYIDVAIEGEVTDYMGVSYHYSEKSCIHLESAKYSMNMEDDYAKFLNYIINGVCAA